MKSKRPRPTPPDNHRCIHLKADGSRCKAWRVTGLMTCIHHTPDLTTKAGLTPGHQNNRKTGFRAQSIKPLTTPEAVNDDLSLRHLQLNLFLEDQPDLDVGDLAKISVNMTRNAHRLIRRLKR